MNSNRKLDGTNESNFNKNWHNLNHHGEPTCITTNLNETSAPKDHSTSQCDKHFVRYGRYDSAARNQWSGRNKQEKPSAAGPLSNGLASQMFQEMAKIYSGTSSFPTAIDKATKLIVPFADEDTRISFVNHYGDTFYHDIRNDPKVMKFEKTTDNKTETLNKLRLALEDIVNELHNVTADRYSCTEIDFLKIVFTNPKPPNPPPDPELNSIDLSTLFEEKSGQLPHHIHRMCLDAPEETLINALSDNGVTILGRKLKKDNIKVEVYSWGFQFDNHVFGGAVNVRPDDLSFASWNVYRWTTGCYILPNPGNECNSKFQTEGGDIRLKGLASVTVKIKELKEMAEKLGASLPSCLTSANLGGLLERNGEGKFTTDLNSGIVGIYLITNRIEYEMSINGIRFHLIVGDMNFFKKIRHSLIIDRCGIRWPKFKIPVPSKNRQDIANHVNTFSDLIMNLLHSLSTGRLLPKIWQTNYIHREVPTPSRLIQNLRRRIVENDSLSDMLDLPPESSRNDIKERLVRLLKAINEGRVPLSTSTVDKLKQAAQSENFLQTPLKVI